MAELKDTAAAQGPEAGVRAPAGAGSRFGRRLAEITRGAGLSELEVYRTMAEALPGILCFIDEQRRLRDWNRRCSEVTGYSEAELAGMPALGLFAEEDAERAAAALSQAQDEGRMLAEIHLRPKDGSRIPYLFSGSRLLVAGRKCCVGLGLDLTVQPQAQCRAERERTLREREAELNATLEATLDGVLVLDSAGGVIHTNRRFAEIFSLPELPARGTSWVQLRRVLSGCRPLSESGAVVAGDLLDRCLRGPEPAAQARQTWGLDDRRVVAVESWPLRREGTVRGRVCTFRDVTEQRDLEHQLRHSQKMESIGRLAGGIAHDFNNILFSIMSISDVLLLDQMGDEDLRHDLRQIKQAAERAAGLTRQLLAFSRKQVLTLAVLDLNEVLQGLAKVLPRLIGEDVELRFELASCPCPVEADRHQLEQILMCLAVNSRDAMPDGGRLEIRTAVVQRGDAPATPAAGGSPGRYVALTVADSGHGMSTETAAQIFEPFFSTKEPGKGTGLGLATVYGIVKQHRGDIAVRSVEGAGTTFEICLPWVDAERARAAGAATQRSPVAVGRGETILVVEDDPAVQQVACRILRKHSYRYLCAADGAAAIALASRRDETIDLLLTDVIMPAMNGPQLYQRLHRLRPDLKVVYMSGYSDETIGQHGVLDQGVHFLQKPFSVTALLRTVRAVLDA